MNRFTPQINSLTLQFAERAIEKQPLDYLKVVASDTLRTFRWTREGTGDTGSSSAGNLEGSGSKFRFESAAVEAKIEAAPGWVKTDPANAHAARDFGGANYGQTSVVEPWSVLLRGYQKVVYPARALRVPDRGGRGGRRLARHPPPNPRPRHRLGRPAAAPAWLVGVALIVLPPLTAGFSYRYVLAAVPAICLAAGLAFCGRGSLITWLRGLKRATSEPGNGSA